MKALITSLFLFLAFVVPVYSQQKITNTDFVQWNKDRTIPVYVKLSFDKSPFKGKESIRFIRETFQASNDIQFKAYQTLKDDLGFEHIRYQIYYKNVPVEGSVIIGHYLQNKLHSFNGEYYGELKNDNQTTFTEEKALNKAILYVNAEKYMWQIPAEEAMVKLIKEDDNATYFPEGKLFYCSDGLTFNANDFRLAYRFNIYASEPHSRKYIFVDAKTGGIIQEQNLIHEKDVKGSAKTRYSGTQSITTDSINATRYRLRQTTNGKGIETYNMNNGTSYGAAVDFIDTDNIWNNVNSKQDEIATDAHWGAEQTYLYFFNEHSRKSFDDKDAKIKSYVHRGTKYNNAFWNGSVMTYGDGDGTRFTPLTSIDVCGHEVSHAVTTYTAGLVYRYESGALNESFSDIFGNLIERYARPAQYSYKIGEDITPNKSGLRNMANPNVKGHPDTYKGTLWRTGTGDNGGVHSNSGVQNYWFYVLAEGKKDKNDNNDSFDVQGIGHSKAGKIAYRNLAVYLTKNSQYADARFYAIRSAIDLYGDCSNELKQTTNAWYAVGVGNEYDTNVTANFIADPNLVCFTTDTIQFLNASVNAKSFKWYFGDGDSSIIKESRHGYNSYSSFTVKLIATSCTGYTFDTLIRTNYIKVDSSRLVCKSDFMPPFGNGDTITKCRGYLMDNGKDKDYITLRITTRTIAPLNATKVKLHFLEFAMEDKYDSLYVYNGKSTSAPLLGAYTGFSIPPDLTANSGAVTFKHFADPLKVHSGFVVQYSSEKNPLKIIQPSDTNICIGDSLEFVAHSSNGGNEDEMEYYWTEKNIRSDTFKFSPSKDTLLRVIVKDNCMFVSDTTYVNIKVYQALDLTTTPDTTICFGEFFKLTASAVGGDTINHVFNWNNGLKPGKSNWIKGVKDTSFQVIVSDGCSTREDTSLINITVRDSLILNITLDTTICQGNNVQLNANGLGGNKNYTYTWDNGLGVGKSHLVSPIKTTTYLVVLSDGCTSPNQAKAITISVLDSLKITLFKDSTICFGNTMNLTTVVSGGNGKYNYVWDKLPGNVSSQVVNPTIKSQYLVTLSDGCTKVAAKDSVQIDVRNPLKVTLNKDTTICYGTSVDLMAMGSGGKSNQYNYTWDNGLGIGGLKKVNPVTNTTYRVILSDACTPRNDTNYINITVLAPLDFTKTKDTTICIGESVDLRANGTGGKVTNHSFSWDNGLGIGTQFNVTPLVTTTYTITLSDACSNPINKSILVTVNAKPLVEFDADKYKICTGDSIQFTNQTKGVIGTEFLWNFNDGSTSTKENPKYIFNKIGLFDVSLYLKNNTGCEGIANKVQFIEVIPKPVANFDFTPEEPDYFNSMVTFNNTSDNGVTYNWTFGNGDNSSTKSPVVTYGDTGNYLVKLIVSNALGCMSTIQKNVFVKDVYVLFDATAFSPNGDGINEVFRLQGRGIVQLEISIYNRWGEKLFHTDDINQAWDGKINKSDVIAPAGTYIYVASLLDVNGLKRHLKGTIMLLR